VRLFIYLQDFPADGQPPQLGICKAVHGLAHGFAENGNPVVVLCQGEKTVTKTLAPGYTVQCFAGAPPGRLFGTVAPELRDYVWANREDALYVLNGIFHPGACAMSALLRKSKIPYIVAPHDPYHPNIFSKRSLLKWPYWYLRERPMLKGALAMQVLDVRHAQWPARLGIKVPVFEATNGYSPIDLLPESELSWHEDKPPAAVFMGRIDSHNKGLDILLDALAELTPDIRPTLTIQGPDWGDKAALRTQANLLGLDQSVHFADADFSVTSSSLIARHDIFCLVSRFEGFGLAALEAMLAGRVVIVSDIAGIAPHVRRSGCGIVITPDVRSVREGLIELLHMRPKWKTMGLAGREYALEHLRWQNIAADAWKQYQRLMAPRNVTQPVATGLQQVV
jgi:glycosyltransferase involved in cell wall biosynthesis